MSEMKDFNKRVVVPVNDEAGEQLPPLPSLPPLPFIDGNGVEAPFGDGVEEFPFGRNESYRSEKGYEKVCKGCSGVMSEAMKDIIPDGVWAVDEIFYCHWCDFIQTTGIDDLLVAKDKNIVSEEDEYEEYEDDGMDGLWELEDAGAFSDEGIMPGCHSGCWDYESEINDIEQEFKDMAFVGKCIKVAREKAGLSIEELANRMDMPESFITDIENGDYIKNCSDGIIRERVADYLCEVLNPKDTTECDNNVQAQGADSDDDLPF